MARRTFTGSWVKGVLVALIVFLATTVAARAAGEEAAPISSSPAASSPADPFTAFAKFLESTGPFGVAVLAGWWAWKKDREKNDAIAAHNAQIKEMYAQVVGIVSAQTAAVTKMEGAVAALKEAIVAVLPGRK